MLFSYIKTHLLVINYIVYYIINDQSLKSLKLYMTYHKHIKIFTLYISN